MAKLFIQTCFFTFLNFLLFTKNLSAQILINEYSAANWKQFQDNHLDYEDWIELYNTTNSAVDLGGWSLTDNPNKPQKWVFKTPTNIPANGFVRVWCSGRDTQLVAGMHTNFKLSQTKKTAEKITLVRPDGIFADQIEVQKTKTHQSQARETDGASNWKICTQPSPKLSNDVSTKFTRFADRPAMDKTAGFYKDSVVVSVETVEPGGEIRFTLDGSEPNLASPIYTKPLVLKKTAVVKAATFSADPQILPSFVQYNTYFINVDHSMVVVSIGADGVLELANGDQNLRPIGSFEYFGKDKTRKTRSYGELNSHGQDSWANDQRSLDWISRDEFGYSAALEEQIFEISPRKDYQRIILRASGDDNYPAAHHPQNAGSAHMRDDYVQSLAKLGGMRLDVRASTRCIVYLNGQYWGIYSFRENPDDHDYTDFYYKQGKFDLQYVLTWGNTWAEYGGQKAITDWSLLRAYINTKNMADSANYKYVTDRLDVLSLIDYFVVNTNTVCSDWLNYNTGWWRGLDPAGEHKKWGYILWDNDATFGFYINYTGVPDTSPFAKPCDIDEFDTNWGNPDPEQHIKVLTRLRKNPEFEQLYVSRQADMANTVFSCENMLHVLDSMAAVIEPEMAMHAERWYGTFDEWKANLARLRYFVERKCALLDDGLIDCYEIEGPWPVTFMVDPPAAGTISVNTLPASGATWTGEYFSNMENKLVAAPAAGLFFDRWQSKLAAIAPDPANPSVSVTLNGADTIVAKFRLTSATFDPSGHLKAAVFPTVFDRKFTVQMETTENLPVSLQLFNSVGQPVAGFDLGNFSGERVEPISLPFDLPEGVYFLQIQAGRFQKMVRMVRN